MYCKVRVIASIKCRISCSNNVTTWLSMKLGPLCLLSFLASFRGLELNRHRRSATFYLPDLLGESRDYQYSGPDLLGESRDYQYNGYKASGRLTSPQSTPNDRYSSGMPTKRKFVWVIGRNRLYSYALKNCTI